MLTAAFAALLLAVPGAGRAEDAGLVSGTYDDGMMIAYDPATHIVSGYYASATGEGKFSCAFYLTGKLAGREADVSTYYPGESVSDLIKGRLVVEDDKSLRIVLPSEHGGCWNVQHFADERQPAEFSLATAHPWTSVIVVLSDRAYFFDAPRAAQHRKAYVVKGDALGVRAFQFGWYYVDFVSDGKTVSGWIRQMDVH